jgi:hypothetical protein
LRKDYCSLTKRIVTGKALPWLISRCLHYATRSRPQRSIRIFLIDDTSRDGSQEYGRLRLCGLPQWPRWIGRQCRHATNKPSPCGGSFAFQIPRAFTLPCVRQRRPAAPIFGSCSSAHPAAVGVIEKQKQTSPAGPFRKTAFETRPAPHKLKTKTHLRDSFCSRNFLAGAAKRFASNQPERHHSGSGLLTACSARSRDWSSTILAVRYIGPNGLRVVAT